MSGPLRAADVIVGLLTENTTRMLAQAIRLARSIRWFGGELAGVRIVAAGVGPLEPAAQATLEALGVEVRTVKRFHPANPTANRHSLIAELLDAPQRVLLQLDCDTVVVRDPLPFLSDQGFQAKVAPTPTVNDQVFERLFAHFGVAKPPLSHVTGWSGEPTIPYFNAGVFAIPVAMLRVLAPSWRKFNLALADQPELSAPCQHHMHQASLALALAETGLPLVELPVELNYQINTQHLPPPAGFAELDPVIIHYHHLATDDGFLLPCIYPRAQAHIEAFHERLRAEGVERHARVAAHVQSRPVIVAGMHRSGTSLVAQLLEAMGLHAGHSTDFEPPNMFNPTGLWEHKVAAAINRELLAELSSTWTNVLNLDLAKLPDSRRADYVRRAGELGGAMGELGPFLLKDPRMSLLFPIWREALPGAIAVIPWRDPMAVARSIATRDGRALLPSIALWEHHNRTLLRDSEGLPRVLISYDQLMAEPMRVLQELHAALTELGVQGLTVPSAQSIAQIVIPDFNRSSRTATAGGTLLDSEQTALLESLRTGAALRETIAPISARTRGVLALSAEIETLHIEKESEKQAFQTRLSLLDRLLLEVFQSLTWKIGGRFTGVLRTLRRRKAITAEDRWQELRHDGPSSG
ncbi:MAG: sulfotransferase [Acidobacteriota bacterium]